MLWSRRNWQGIPTLVDLGTSMLDMLLVRGEAEVPYVCALCDEQKQASAGKLYENNLWAIAIVCPWAR